MAIVQEQPNQPSAATLQQGKKKKSKQAQEPVAEVNAPEHRDSDASQQQQDTGNPYVSLASKRLRTLRKRLAKIEKYEEDLASKGADHQLNDDQLQAVQKKQEVLALIKELEELIKQMEDRDAEDQRNAKKQRKQDQQDRQRAIAAAQQEVKHANLQGLRQLTELMFVCNVVFPQMPATLISMQDRQHLIDFVNRISGFHVAIPPSSDRALFDDQVSQAVSLLSSFVEQQMPNYTQVQSVISNSLALFTSGPEPVQHHTGVVSSGADAAGLVFDIPSLIGASSSVTNAGVQLPAGQSQLKFTTTPLIEDPAIVDMKESFEQHQLHEQQQQHQQEQQFSHQQQQHQHDRPPRQQRQHGDKERNGDDGRPFRGARRGRGRGGFRGGARASNGHHQSSQ